MQNSILNDGLELSKGDAIYKVMVNNESSTALKDGNVVILDTSDTEGHGVKLPAAEGDPNVFGVVVHPDGKRGEYAAGDECLICIEGVAMTRVDGTADIAAGKPLQVFDTNGIGYLATVGTNSISCYFGTALDAYTSDDSDGYIPVYVRTR